MKKKIFASSKSLKKGVGSRVGSGSAPKCHGSPTLPSTRLMMILLLVRASIQKDLESNHERVKAVMSAMETMEQDWEARALQLQELQV
jgi:hypothetical protein